MNTGSSSRAGRRWAPGSPTAWAPRTGTCPLRRDARRPGAVGGPQNWSTGFLPATFQGTQFRAGRYADPASEAAEPASTDDAAAQQARPASNDLNRASTAADKADDTELDARIRVLRAGLPDAVGRARGGRSFARRREATKKLYGMDERDHAALWHQLPAGAPAGRARRALRGALLRHRQRWDAHDDHRRNHTKMCRAADKPVAGLLADLKARGLLEDTLVVWGGEFGRTPFNERATAATTIPGASRCGWPAAASRKAGHRHHRRDRPPRGGASGSRPRPARHDPAPAGPRPPAPDLPAQRPGRTRDRDGGEVVKEILA